MNEDTPLELDTLRPTADTRDRVIGAAMAEVRAMEPDDAGPEPGSARLVLASSSRLLRPTLAAAALIVLLLVFPGRTRHPDVVAADVLLGRAVGVDDGWLEWSLRGEHPDPGELLILYGEAGP